MIRVSCSMLQTVVRQAAAALTHVVLPEHEGLALVLWEQMSSLMRGVNPARVAQRPAVPPHLFLSCKCSV